MVFADVIKERWVRPSWATQVDPESGAKTPRQGLEGRGPKPRNAWSHWELGETRREPLLERHTSAGTLTLEFRPLAP